MGRRSAGRLRLAVIGLVTTLIITIGVVMLYVHVRPYLQGTNCEARTSAGVIPLDLDQAANAATIAAVALRKKLPEQAAVIAYATALQESHLRNLGSGDRDSVGIFQQRPSQGWGTARQLKDPVYASGRFFSALVKVHDYTGLPVEVAAQKVQRSADGGAYARHEQDAKILAAAYTGRVSAAVRCWYPPNRRKKRAEPSQALEALSAALKRPDLDDDVRVPNTRAGWTIATWMVAHAQPYGLREIRYAGRHWRVADGHAGWTRDEGAPADRVQIR